MGRRTNNVAETNYPLVNVQRFQSLKCDVNTRQLEELASYIGYVEAVGGDRPTEGEVIGTALAELFKLDRGFQEWKDRPHKSDAGPHKAAEPTAPNKA